MLEVKNISVRFDHRQILRDVSFLARSGEIVVLLGANGAGKTTLLRSLNGTVSIRSGEVLVNGASIDTISRREIARSIAVVAQENETKFPITVTEFVLAGRFARGPVFGWETPDDVAAAEDALRSCDLEGFDGRMMNELSGGERQRVVLARALAAETAVLLLDEPTANLDLAHQAMMFRLVRERCNSSGTISIVITHDLNLAATFADKVIMLKDGSVVADGIPQAVLTAENIRNVYGVRVLLDENPSSGKLRVTTVY